MIKGVKSFAEMLMMYERNYYAEFKEKRTLKKVVYVALFINKRRSFVHIKHWTFGFALMCYFIMK